jgi:hypothetical protein
MNEDTVQSIIRRDFAFIGPIWRNNVGVLPDINGRPVRYGLANDSSQINKEIKSSDLIGITPVFITPEWLGHTVGIFTAIECKSPDWSFSPNDKRAVAQLRFHEIVRGAGGFAGFANEPSQIQQIIRGNRR